MHQHVTIVPGDQLIIVNGEALRFLYPSPPFLHAIQWHEGRGYMEWTNDLNHPLSGPELYAEEVLPYVQLWEAEKARQAQLAAEAEAARLAEYNSTESRAARIRAERDQRITATDYLMASDYPLTDEERSLWAAYRQALRDITIQSGFPWGGADDPLCPWPDMPVKPLFIR